MYKNHAAFTLNLNERFLLHLAARNNASCVLEGVCTNGWYLFPFSPYTDPHCMWLKLTS